MLCADVPPVDMCHETCQCGLGIIGQRVVVNNGCCLQPLRQFLLICQTWLNPLPLAADTLSPEKVRAFMALKAKNLPPADQLIDTLLPRLQAQESVLEEFCRTESIEFVSLTEPLRTEILRGQQTYFTYDQHWTPVGHKVVASTLHHYLYSTAEEKY